MFISFSVSFTERRVSDEVIADEEKITAVLVDTRRILAQLRKQ